MLHIPIQFNWLDIVIVVVFLLYAIEGYAQGFVSATLDLISFVLSFLLGLKFYALVGNGLTSLFNLPQGFANALGFFITALIAELVVSTLFHMFIGKRAKALFIQTHPLTKVNKFAGIVPALCSAVIIISFVLTLIISLPVSPFLKRSISDATLGDLLVVHAQSVDKSLNNVFGGAFEDSLTFLTVEPKSNETVQLHFTTTNVSVDTQAEQQMLDMVNQERTSRGIKPLVMDARLQQIARAHSKDMFARGYFSHYTPSGLSPFDRMAQANIQYNYAGENLALAPNVQLAMQGLMNSPGHRANILEVDFHKVGIGVIDGGIYGEMFTQDFTD